MIKILNLLYLYILPAIIVLILVHAFIKKVPAYESFIEGAKDGFNIAIKIIAYFFYLKANN